MVSIIPDSVYKLVKLLLKKIPFSISLIFLIRAKMAGSEIILNNHVVDPSTQQKGGSQFVKNAVDSNYVLVHCKSFLTTEQKAQLAKLNVRLLSYPAENTYLCRYEPQDLEKIRALLFVVYANVYHPDVVRFL